MNVDFNTQVYPDNPDVVLELLRQYDGNQWSDPEYYKNLSGEQLVAIWLDKKEEMKNNTIVKEFGNTIFSNKNSFFKKSNNDFLENWIYNVYEQLNSENPNWDIIKINLGDTEEDLKEFNVLKKIYEKDPESAISLYEDLLEEELEQIAKNFIFEKKAQNLISKEELKSAIIGNDDLTRTTYGPIDANLADYFDSSIVSEAIQDASRFAPVQGKEILVMDSGDAGPYGVVETELQAKLAKKRIIEKLESYPDYLSEEQSSQIMQDLDQEMQKGAIAFRVNPVKIVSTVEQLMSEITQSANQFGLSHIVPMMYDEVLKLAMGSVIAHEAEHTAKMTSMEGDPDEESRAEGTENRFLDVMLNEEKYKIIKPFISRKGNQISENERNILIQEILNTYGKEPNMNESWYEIS